MAFTLSPNLKCTHCVYFHIRLDTNSVFYVGKGWTTQRPYDKKNRNPHWWNVVNKAGYKASVIRKNLTNEEACRLEKRLIALYRSRRPGVLVNITDGGDGVLGWKHTPEARAKISAAKKGKSVPCPPGRAEAISRAKLNKPTIKSRPVLCNETGEIFQTAREMARVHGINHGQLGHHLNGKKYFNRVKGRTYTWLSR